MDKTRQCAIYRTDIFLLCVVLQCLLCIAFFPSPSLAASVILDWDPSTDADLAGYKVYYQANSYDFPFAGSGAAEGGAPIDVKDVTTTTISGLDPSNSYFFAVTAYNSAGVESVYSNIIEIKESVPPAVTVDAPLNRASVSGTVTVSAGASDNAGVTAVRFFVNGEEVAEKTSAPYSFEWHTASLPPGGYTLSAKAFDAAGNEGVSNPVVVSVAGDTTKPAVSVTAPAAVVSGTVTVSGTATDNAAVASMELHVDGALVLTGNQSQISYPIDTASLANGGHTLCAKAYDAAGNAGDACVTMVVSNSMVDDIPPVISAFVMPSSAGALDVPVQILAAGDNAGVTGYLISESPSAPAASAQGWGSSVPALFRFSAAGVRTAYAWVKDAAGNVSAARSAAVTVTLPDTAAPVASIALPASASTVSGTVKVSLSATDNVAVTKLDFYVNGKLQATTNRASFDLDWNSTTVANGSYTLSAKAYDAAGNIGEASLTVTLSNAREFSLADALTALQVVCGKSGPTVEQAARLDVAPYVDGKSYPDGTIDISDVVVILSWVVGTR